MVDLDSQIVRGLLSNLLTRFLTTTWSIWTLRLCVVYSRIYSLDFWQWHGRFGLSACAWFTLESTHSISDNDMFDLDSQRVRGLLSNLLTRFLTTTWSIWTLSVCVIYSRIYSISDNDMFDLDSQRVRGLLSNLLTRFLTTTWSIWTLSVCVIYSRIYSISDNDMFDLDSQIVRGLLSNLLTRFLTTTCSIWTLRLCVVYSRIYSLDFWQRHVRFGLSVCAWFTLESTHSISDNDVVDLDSQPVRGLLSNLLTRFLTPTWSIWTLSMWVIYSRIYSLDFWQRRGRFGLSACAWFTLESTHSISDTDMVNLDSQHVHGLLSNLLTQADPHMVNLNSQSVRSFSQNYSRNFWPPIKIDFSENVCHFLSNLIASFLTIVGNFVS